MKIGRGELVKAAVLALLLVAAILIVQLTHLGTYLSKDWLQQFVGQFGIFGPLIFILIFSVSIAVLIPASPFTIAAAVIFGLWYGLLLTIIAVLIGSVSAFFIARGLGRNFAKHVAGGLLAKYDDKLKTHGFATIFYLRMTFIPLGPVNYAAGLTGVSFKDFILGTLLGVIPITFIFMFFVSRLTSITSLSDLFAWDIVLAVVLFICSFFIPALVKKVFRKEHILEE